MNTPGMTPTNHPHQPPSKLRGRCTAELLQLLQNADRLAHSSGSATVQVEHLRTLLCALDQSLAQHCSLTLGMPLTQLLGPITTPNPTPTSFDHTREFNVPHSDETKLILLRATLEAAALKDPLIHTGHLLLALLAENEVCIKNLNTTGLSLTQARHQLQPWEKEQAAVHPPNINQD